MCWKESMLDYPSQCLFEYALILNSNAPFRGRAP
jgi:hypothetical protein